jgi:hypothetical protein
LFTRLVGHVTDVEPVEVDPVEVDPPPELPPVEPLEVLPVLVDPVAVVDPVLVEPVDTGLVPPDVDVSLLDGATYETPPPPVPPTNTPGLAYA